MFVHVTCEHVKHDYAPVYTIDVALPNHICTEQIVVLDTTGGHRLVCIGCNTVHKLLCLDLLLSMTCRI